MTVSKKEMCKVFKRHRRLRASRNIRELVKDVYLEVSDLVYPIFIEEGEKIKTEISSMPNIYRLSIDMLKTELEEVYKLGIRSLLLFGIPASKDEIGTEAYNSTGIIQQGIKYIKENYPEFVVITDVCMCEYTSHGHCGLLDENGIVKNDETTDLLGDVALSHVRAGADMVAPSDMMDGRVKVIRKALDKEGYYNIPVMSYSVKYSSAFYGPFRDAADSAPQFGDRKTYQMDYRTKWEAFSEAEADIKQGADILIVKPALAYMDIIYKLKERYDIPIACYNVSAEYSMIKAAAINGWIDEKSIVMEKMYAFKRAGASIIITYFAKDIAKWLSE